MDRIALVTKMDPAEMTLTFGRKRCALDDRVNSFLCRAPNHPFTLTFKGATGVLPVVRPLSKAALKRKAAEPAAADSIASRVRARSAVASTADDDGDGDQVDVPLKRRRSAAAAAAAAEEEEEEEEEEEVIVAKDDDDESFGSSSKKRRVVKVPMLAEAPAAVVLARPVRRKATDEDALADDEEWQPRVSKAQKRRTLLADVGAHAAVQAGTVSDQLFTDPVLFTILWFVAEDASSYAAFRLVCRAWRLAQLRDWRSFDRLVTLPDAINWRRRFTPDVDSDSEEDEEEDRYWSRDDSKPTDLEFEEGSLKQGSVQRLFSLSKTQLRRAKEFIDIRVVRETNRYRWVPRGDTTEREFELRVHFWPVKLLWEWLCYDEVERDDDDDSDGDFYDDERLALVLTDAVKARAFASMVKRLEVRWRRHVLKKRRIDELTGADVCEQRRAQLLRYVDKAIDRDWALVQPEATDFIDYNLRKPKEVATALLLRWNRRAALNRAVRQVDDTAPLDWWLSFSKLEPRVATYVFDGTGGAADTTAFLLAAFARQRELQAAMLAAGLPVNKTTTMRDDVLGWIADKPAAERWNQKPQPITLKALVADIRASLERERAERAARRLHAIESAKREAQWAIENAKRVAEAAKLQAKIDEERRKPNKFTAVSPAAAALPGDPDERRRLLFAEMTKRGMPTWGNVLLRRDFNRFVDNCPMTLEEATIQGMIELIRMGNHKRH